MEAEAASCGGRGAAGCETNLEELPSDVAYQRRNGVRVCRRVADVVLRGAMAVTTGGIRRPRIIYVYQEEIEKFTLF